jgi:hypothetical protein
MPSLWLWVFVIATTRLVARLLPLLIYALNVEEKALLVMGAVLAALILSFGAMGWGVSVLIEQIKDLIFASPS